MVTRDTPTSLGPPLRVPANASRFFADPALAAHQPHAEIQLVWDDEDPFLRNGLFDPSVIAHDEAYCTSVVDLDQVRQVPTAEYFVDAVLPHAGPSSRVCDIGCGQGEFVDRMRARGVQVTGFDPVLRQESAYLHRRYWTPLDENGAADVYVMRCVLPHIPDPWAFLTSMGEQHPQSLVLIEFQRLEWILDSAIWYQLSHDHVNVFSARDFEARFDVVDQGIFGNGEWAWVLVRAGSHEAAPPRPSGLDAAVSGLLRRRQACLQSAVALDRPVAVWGAAGKGIVLTDALTEAGARVTTAIDADPVRHGLYMEVSGVGIISPEQAAASLPDDTVVMVCNPNHLDAVKQRMGDTSWDVIVPADLAS